MQEEGSSWHSQRTIKKAAFDLGSTVPRTNHDPRGNPTGRLRCNRELIFTCPMRQLYPGFHHPQPLPMQIGGKYPYMYNTLKEMRTCIYVFMLCYVTLCHVVLCSVCIQTKDIFISHRSRWRCGWTSSSDLALNSGLNSPGKNNQLLLAEGDMMKNQKDI